MKKYSKHNLWLISALIVIGGCGPIAPSVSKIGAPSSTSPTASGASANDNTNASALDFFGVNRVGNESNNTTAQSLNLMANDVKFVSGLKPRSSARDASSPFEQMLNESFYSQLSIGTGNRLEIQSDNSVLAALKSGQNSITLDASALDSIDNDSKIYVLVEMLRAQNQIPSQDLLPLVNVAVRKSGRSGSDHSQRITLSFSEVLDPTSEPRAHLLQDTSRIFIFLSKE